MAAAHAIADRENRQQIIVRQVSVHLAGALRSNCSETPKSCPRVGLKVGPDILQGLIDRRHRHLIELADQRRCQLEALLLEPALHARPSSDASARRRLALLTWSSPKRF